MEDAQGQRRRWPSRRHLYGPFGSIDIRALGASRFLDRLLAPAHPFVLRSPRSHRGDRRRSPEAPVRGRRRALRSARLNPPFFHTQPTATTLRVRAAPRIISRRPEATRGVIGPFEAETAAQGLLGGEDAVWGCGST